MARERMNKSQCSLLRVLISFSDRRLFRLLTRDSAHFHLTSEKPERERQRREQKGSHSLARPSSGGESSCVCQSVRRGVGAPDSIAPKSIASITPARHVTAILKKRKLSVRRKKGETRDINRMRQMRRRRAPD